MKSECFFAHEQHFLWQDLPIGIKIFVLVTLTIFEIGHDRGHLCFTNKSCLLCFYIERAFACTVWVIFFIFSYLKEIKTFRLKKSTVVTTAATIVFTTVFHRDYHVVPPQRYRHFLITTVFREKKIPPRSVEHAKKS